MAKKTKKPATQAPAAEVSMHLHTKAGAIDIVKIGDRLVIQANLSASAFEHGLHKLASALPMLLPAASFAMPPIPDLPQPQARKRRRAR